MSQPFSQPSKFNCSVNMIEGSFRAAYNKLLQQKGNVEARAVAPFHDRFIMVDGAVCYQLGSSINHLGNRAAVIDRKSETIRDKVLSEFGRCLALPPGSRGHMQSIIHATDAYPGTERMFEASFNATLDRYRKLLGQVGAGRPDLPNDNFDTGEATGPRKYGSTMRRTQSCSTLSQGRPSLVLRRRFETYARIRQPPTRRLRELQQSARAGVAHHSA
jgi:hypothetical protein